MGRIKQEGDNLVYLPKGETVLNHAIMLEAPRSHAKSTEFTVSFPLWKIGNDPNVRIVICTEVQSQANSFLREITQELEKNERYKEVYGNLVPAIPDKWTQNEIIVDRTATKLKDPTVSATSAGGTILSKRADIIICDDILSERNTKTAEQREKIRDWFWTSLYPILEPDGILIVVGTAWNDEDLYQLLLDDQTFDIRAKYQAVTDWKNHETLWPERWSYDELMKRKKRMGNRSFYRSYQNVVLSAEDAIFKRPWLSDAKRKGAGRRLIKSFDYAHWDLGEVLMGTGMDLAISEKTTADDNAIAVIGKIRQGQYAGMYIPLWLEASDKDHKWGPAEQRSRLVGVYENYNYNLPLILVENNGYQAAFQRDVADQTDLPIRGYTTGGEKFDEYIGINSMAVGFENGKWILPYDSEDEYTRTMINRLVDGLLAFPSGHTHDIVMAVWFAYTALRDLEQGSAGAGEASWGDDGFYD